MYLILDGFFTADELEKMHELDQSFRSWLDVAEQKRARERIVQTRFGSSWGIKFQLEESWSGNNFDFGILNAFLTAKVLRSKGSCSSISLWRDQGPETRNRPLFTGPVQLRLSESTSCFTTTLQGIGFLRGSVAFRVLGAFCEYLDFSLMFCMP